MIAICNRASFPVLHQPMISLTLEPLPNPEGSRVELILGAWLIVLHDPPPQAPPPFGPLPSIPRTALLNASDPICNFDYLYEEPAYPDSPTIPPGLFQEDSLPSAY